MNYAHWHTPSWGPTSPHPHLGFYEPFIRQTTKAWVLGDHSHMQNSGPNKENFCLSPDRGAIKGTDVFHTYLVLSFATRTTKHTVCPQTHTALRGKPWVGPVTTLTTAHLSHWHLLPKCHLVPASKPANQHNSYGRNEVCVHSLCQDSIVRKPTMLNSLQTPSGRELHHKYLKLQIMKKQEERNTNIYIHPTNELVTW